MQEVVHLVLRCCDASRPAVYADPANANALSMKCQAIQESSQAMLLLLSLVLPALLLCYAPLPSACSCLLTHFCVDEKLKERKKA